MRHWTFWEWVAYGALLVAALILAADTGLRSAPDLLSTLPAFFRSGVWGFAPLLLVVVATIILLIHELRPNKPPLQSVQSIDAIVPIPKKTEIFLQFSDEHTVPREIRQSNILSWYALYTESIYIRTAGKNNEDLGGFSVPPRWTVFMLFKQPAVYRQMLATCSGPKSPKCAVQFSNAFYAIITLTGDVGRAALEVTTAENS